MPIDKGKESARGRIASADRMTGKGGYGEKEKNERKRTNLKTLFIILAAALI